MTSEEVVKMANDMRNNDEVEVIPETNTASDIKPENIDNSSDVSRDNNAVNTTTEQEKVVDVKKSDKEKYAFAKLKNKEKAKRQKLISEYEERIKNLNDELERFKGLGKDNFKSDEEYVNYLFDRKLKENETNQLSLAKQQAEAEAFDEINQQRIMACFPDEKDRESYNQLVSEAAPKFVELLDKADPDNAVLSYLDDCDIAPLLIRVMMTKPEYRNEVLSKKNPFNKIMALDNLAKRLSFAKKIVDRKPTMPIIGKVAKTESAVVIDKNDPNYWNNMLRQMNQARGK